MTNTDFIYELLSKSKKPIAFSDLVQKLIKKNHFDISRVSDLYSDLSFDNRFISLKDNKWDLASRYTYEEIHREVEIYDEEEYFEDEDDMDEDFDTDDSPVKEKSISQVIDDYDTTRENEKYED